MDYYKCADCGYVCEREELNVIENRHPYGDTYAEERYVECPICGSGDIEAASECHVCGEYHSGEGDVCDDCLNERITFKDVRKYSEDRRFSDIEVKLPNYLAHILDTDIIVEVLEEHLKANFKHYIGEVKEYLDEDMHDFAEWVKRQ
jgi:hypothetical protein